jgi:hypothetical protein
MPTLDLVTFGGGLSKYRRAMRRLGREAAVSGAFSRVSGFTDRDLFRRFPAFCRTHSDILRWNVRGFGYWIWKPFLIRQVMNDSSADVVAYIDSGCTLNLPTPTQRSRLDDYAAIAASTGLLAFQLSCLERVYCKSDTANRIGLTEAQLATGQYMATAMMFRRSRAMAEFVEEWCAIMAEESHRFCNDAPSASPEHPDFVEHRHDQSVFSCLAKREGFAAIPDETFFWPEWTGAARDAPIWATRHFSGCRFRPGSPPSLVRRCELLGDRLERKALRWRRS